MASVHRPTVVQGRIVWAAVPDPQGMNLKPRRCLIVSTPDEIATSNRVRIVGITTDFYSMELAPYFVPLQWGSSCRTFLTEACSALCTWVIEIDKGNVESTRGFINPPYVEKILLGIQSAEANGFPIPCHSL